MTKKWQKNDRDKGQDQNKKQQKNDKKMTEKWQGQMTGQKKNDRSKWQKNDNANDKIIIFMYPSVWLQVPSNRIRLRPVSPDARNISTFLNGQGF